MREQSIKNQTKEYLGKINENNSDILNPTTKDLKEYNELERSERYNTFINDEKNLRDKNKKHVSKKFKTINVNNPKRDITEINTKDECTDNCTAEVLTKDEMKAIINNHDAYTNEFKSKTNTNKDYLLEEELKEAFNINKKEENTPLESVDPELAKYVSSKKVKIESNKGKNSKLPARANKEVLDIISQNNTNDQVLSKYDDKKVAYVKKNDNKQSLSNKRIKGQEGRAAKLKEKEETLIASINEYTDSLKEEISK